LFVKRRIGRESAKRKGKRKCYFHPTACILIESLFIESLFIESLFIESLFLILLFIFYFPFIFILPIHIMHHFSNTPSKE